MNILRWLCFSAYALTGAGELIFVLMLFQASGEVIVLPLGLPVILLSLFAAFFAYREKNRPGLLASVALLACPTLLMQQHLMLFEDAFWLMPAPTVGLLYFGLKAGLTPPAPRQAHPSGEEDHARSARP